MRLVRFVSHYLRHAFFAPALNSPYPQANPYHAFFFFLFAPFECLFLRLPPATHFLFLLFQIPHGFFKKLIICCAFYARFYFLKFSNFVFILNFKFMILRFWFNALSRVFLFFVCAHRHTHKTSHPNATHQIPCHTLSRAFLRHARHAFFIFIILNSARVF